MMIARALQPSLEAAAKRFPAVTLTGPRQSGKTTLVRATLPDHAYVSLEPPDERGMALSDPRGFLARFKGPAILDEVQRASELFSYIQEIVDADNRPGRFILTGSQNFLLLETISQTLAGRCSVLHLLPFALSELLGRPPMPADSIGRELPARAHPPGRSLEDALFAGFYPPMHAKAVPPREWLSSYYRTYVERDVRSVLNVGDLEAFGRFTRLCAGRHGQILNLSSLASDCGVSHTTARRWLSILEATFIVSLLRPYDRSFGKRLVRSPKLYFMDTGLLCYLLGIRAPEELHVHASRGAVFEGFALSELAKHFLNRGDGPPLHFWRDSAGREVDILVGAGTLPAALEVKSGRTVAPDSLDGLLHWRKLCRGPRGARRPCPWRRPGLPAPRGLRLPLAHPIDACPSGQAISALGLCPGSSGQSHPPTSSPSRRRDPARRGPSSARD